MSDTPNTVKDETIKVSAFDRDEEGNKLEPEEKPAERTRTMDVQVMGTLGAHPGTMAAAIAEQKTVGEFAQEIRQKCGGCKHWNMGAWQQMKLKLERSLNPADKRMLLQLKDVLIRTFNAAPGEADNALGFLGICHAQTEILTARLGRHEDAITHPESGCELHEPVGGDGTKVIDKAYDSIMRIAQGN